MRKLTYVTFNKRPLAVDFVNNTVKDNLCTICEDETTVIVYYWVYDND